MMYCRFCGKILTTADNLDRCYPSCPESIERKTGLMITLQPDDYIELVKERDQLKVENARLREQLRWHPVSELPRKTKSIPEWSVNVIFKRSTLEESVAYYNFKSKRWKSLYSHTTIIVESGDKWCYIPDDNQGDTEGE